MIINQAICIGCGQCITFCPVDAIFEDHENGVSIINLEKCVECGNCLRQAECPVEAISQQELIWPRSIRSIMSDPLTITSESGIAGRGTEEMKTNDVTGRFKLGSVGIGIEMGRPILGAYFRDIEKVSMAVASFGVLFEICNPLTSLMSDKETGRFPEEILDEKVLSTIIEFTIPIEKLKELLMVLKDVSMKIDTVFSLCLASRLDEDEIIPTQKILNELGIWFAPNGKTNVGLGRPLFIDSHN